AGRRGDRARRVGRLHSRQPRRGRARDVAEPAAEDGMTATAVELPAVVERSRFRRFLRRFPMSSRFAALLLIVYVLVALTGPLWTPYDPYQASTGPPLSGASWQHLFGTDILGRDIFSRVVVGTRPVLYLALTSPFVSLVIGGVI